MSNLTEIDREIRRLTRGAKLSRPFLCSGSPIGCEVAEVGINPGTDTPFWPYWNSETGCNKEGWLAEYLRRNGRLKPTRDRIEVLCKALAPLRCLELNLYHHYSKAEALLSREHQDTALFDFMLEVAKPSVLLLHGNTPIRHLSGLLGVLLPKGRFVAANYRGRSMYVFAAERHFAYVSREYVASLGAQIRIRVLANHAQRSSDDATWDAHVGLPDTDTCGLAGPAIRACWTPGAQNCEESRQGEPLELTKEAFARYLEENQGTHCHLSRGSVYTFRIAQAPSSEFPYSIHFRSDQWNPSTVRMCSGSRVQDFLVIFNQDPEAGPERYRNHAGAGSPARVLTYLLPLMREARRRQR